MTNTIIGGIPIPSSSPAFLGGVGVHVAAGLVCVVAGAVAMLSRKGHGRHSASGSIYYWSLSVVFVTAVALSVVRWAEDYPLFILAALSFGSATFGRRAIKAGWLGRYRPHVIGMGTSYILLVTAFYVDNGKSLPLWRDLPPVAYWLTPGVIGFPILIYALKRHPLTRR